MPLAYQVLAIRIFHFYHGAKVRKNKITTKLLEFFLYNLFKIRKFRILSYGNLLTLSLSTGVGRCLHDVTAQRGYYASTDVVKALPSLMTHPHKTGE